MSRSSNQSLRDLLRVKPGSKVNLARDFDPGYKAGFLKKKDGATVLNAGAPASAPVQFEAAKTAAAGRKSIASTITTPRIAVNEIDEAMSSPSAPMTGATAAPGRATAAAVMLFFVNLVPGLFVAVVGGQAQGAVR